MRHLSGAPADWTSPGLSGHNRGVSAQSIASSPLLTLPAAAPRALTAQALLVVAAAWALPALAHLTGLPVGTLLPMHWPVLLAGLCYGWRSGLAVGASAPIASYLLSGMPPPPVLAPMVAELAVYGCVAGFVRERLGRSGIEAVLAAVIAGRVVFVGVMLASGLITGPLTDYLRLALVPGAPAMAAQVLLLPALAAWWVRREATQRRTPSES